MMQMESLFPIAQSAVWVSLKKRVSFRPKRSEVEESHDGSNGNAPGLIERFLDCVAFAARTPLRSE